MRRERRGGRQPQHWAKEQHRTLNNKRRTPGGSVAREWLGSVFGVRGWMFDV